MMPYWILPTLERYFFERVILIIGLTALCIAVFIVHSMSFSATQVSNLLLKNDVSTLLTLATQLFYPKIWGGGGMFVFTISSQKDNRMDRNMIYLK